MCLIAERAITSTFVLERVEGTYFNRIMSFKRSKTHDFICEMGCNSSFNLKRTIAILPRGDLSNMGVFKDRFDI